MTSPAKIYFGVLDELIRTGVIRNREVLESTILGLGWSIIRRGDDYFTIKTPECRFRFRFEFGDASVECWIYALIAVISTGEKACYIGCTTGFNERMEQHFAVSQRKLTKGKTSREFFAWARAKQSKVFVLVLEKVMGRSRMYAQERKWTDVARTSGWSMPGEERWASKAARPIASSCSDKHAIPEVFEVQTDRLVTLEKIVALNISPDKLLNTRYAGEFKERLATISDQKE